MEDVESQIPFVFFVFSAFIYATKLGFACKGSTFFPKARVCVVHSRAFSMVYDLYSCVCVCVCCVRRTLTRDEESLPNRLHKIYVSQLADVFVFYCFMAEQAFCCFCCGVMMVAVFCFFSSHEGFKRGKRGFERGLELV